ncbi:MAG: hypothetical protein PHT94_03395 [Candidatus Nanoarchaeia archaeon]|nr:hypothetical protein [Candidatus Nanoarchaeia archaeon]
MFFDNIFGSFYTIVIVLFAGSIFFALLEKSKLFSNSDGKSIGWLNALLAFSAAFFVAISPFVQNLLRIMTSYMTILIVLGFFILFVFYIFNYNDNDVKMALGEDEKALSTILFIIILVILIISLASSMGSDLLNKEVETSTMSGIDLSTTTQTSNPSNYNSSEYLSAYEESNKEVFYETNSNNQFEENVFNALFDSKVLAIILFFLFAIIFVSQINNNKPIN